MKARVIRYLSAAVFCALLVWLYVSGRDPWTLPLVEQYRIWCDAFTIPGLLLVLAEGASTGCTTPDAAQQQNGKSGRAV